MLDLATFTAIHTIISIVAILTGIPAVLALLGRQVAAIWTSSFLVTAALTSATGFGFPFTGVLPSHVVGAVALVVLAVAIFARVGAHFAGAWRWIYAAGLVASLYFLIFVAIAQAFGKIPALKAAAPTLSEPPFAIAQGVALILFIGLGIAACRKFRPGLTAAA